MGYSDITFIDKASGIGVALELKRSDSGSPAAMAACCERAIEQTKSRKYHETFLGTGVTRVRLCGIAFSGKDCRILAEETTLPQ